MASRGSEPVANWLSCNEMDALLSEHCLSLDSVSTRGYVAQSNKAVQVEPGVCWCSFLNGFVLVEARGFEPPTTPTPRVCATKLRYASRIFSLR